MDRTNYLRITCVRVLREDEGNDEAVQAQSLGEDQDQNHADEELLLLPDGPHAGVADDPDRHACRKPADVFIFVDDFARVREGGGIRSTGGEEEGGRGLEYAHNNMYAERKTDSQHLPPADGGSVFAAKAVVERTNNIQIDQAQKMKESLPQGNLGLPPSADGPDNTAILGSTTPFSYPIGVENERARGSPIPPFPGTQILYVE